jgi:hypothetical protein
MREAQIKRIFKWISVISVPPGKAEEEAMSIPHEFSISVHFDRAADGRYYVHSPNVIGLHLAGTDIDLIRGEIERIVKDLLRLNHQLEADEIRWVPSLDHVVKALKGDADKVPERQETYLVKVA